jgi:DNA-directed RNA polymerase I, II, and III subunit RPABC2
MKLSRQFFLSRFVSYIRCIQSFIFSNRHGLTPKIDFELIIRNYLTAKMEDEDDYIEEFDEFAEEDLDIAQLNNKAAVEKEFYKQHPECIIDYMENIYPRLLLKEVPTINADENHTTYPFLTIFEKTKVLGFRTNQLSQGSRPYVTVPEEVTDVQEIARLELYQKKLPYILKRPLPDGTYEYWRLADLMILE